MTAKTDAARTIEPDEWPAVEEGDTVEIEYESNASKTAQTRRGEVVYATDPEDTTLKTRSIKIAVGGYSYDAVRVRFDEVTESLTVSTSTDGVHGSKVCTNNYKIEARVIEQ